MALKDCLKKFGKAVSEKDRAALQSLIDAGLDEKVAVEQYIKAMEMSRLEGAPVGFKTDDSFFGTGNFEPAVQAAKDYMESIGLEYTPPTMYAKVDEKRAARIAAEYDRLRHAPSNPEVKKAYRAMIKETIAQYKVILKTGLVVESIDGPNPYKRTIDVINDVRDNNHIYYFKTADGFGTDASFDPKSNPLLEETEFVSADGQPMLANDVFRVVHDYFGHVKNGVTFRAIGEENAWQSHAAMYSPLARRAMTSETRGQNSWLNYGPHGEKNRTAKVEDTIFADQKTGLLPLWVSEEARLSADERNERYERLRAEGNTGLEGAIDSEGYVEIIHYSDTELQRNNPRKWGQGLSGRVRSEQQRIKGGVPRTYFGVESAIQNGYKKETGLGRIRHVAKIHGSLLYDLGRDPENFYDLDPDVIEQRIRDANYSGYYRNNGSFGKIAAVFDELPLELSQEKPVEEVQTLHQAQRNMIGLFSAVEQAILDMDLQQWRESKKDKDVIQHWVYPTEDSEAGRKFETEDEAKSYAKEAGWIYRPYFARKANAKEIWAKLQKTKGVKKEELELLDMENYLQTKDAFTRNEIVSYIHDNGVVIEEIVADQEKTEGEIEWNPYGDVVNERYHWEHRIEDFIYDFERGDDTFFWGTDQDIEWLSKNINQAIKKYKDDIPEEHQEKFNEFMDADYDSYDIDEFANFFNDIKNIREDFLDEMKPEFENLAEVHAEEEYLNDPIYVWESDNSDYKIEGNDDYGYSAWHPRYGQVLDAGEVWSLSEAQVRVNAHAYDNGEIDSSGESVARWADYLDTDRPYENYRELKLTLPDIKEDFYETAHFEDRNVVAFLRVTDRELGPETDEFLKDLERLEAEDKSAAAFYNNKSKHFFVDEFQSDWHQHGREFGYKKGMTDEEYHKLKMDTHELGARLEEEIRPFREQYLTDANISEASHRDVPLIDFIEIAMRTAKGIKAEKIKDKLKVTWNPDTDYVQFIQDWMVGEGDFEGLHDFMPTFKEDLIKFFDDQSSLEAEDKGAPDAPFKGDAWIALGLKRALVHAIENGYSSFSWADSTMLIERWSENYRELYETHYDKKMTGIVKKLTGIAPERFLFASDFKAPALDPVGRAELSEKIKDIRRDISIVARYGSSYSGNPQASKTIFRILEDAYDDGDPILAKAYDVIPFDVIRDVFERTKLSIDEAIESASDERNRKRFKKAFGYIIDYMKQNNLYDDYVASFENVRSLKRELKDLEDEFFNNPAFSTPQAGYWTIPITEELKAEVLGKGFPLFQDGDDAKRGSLTLLSDSSKVMKLTYKKDSSTIPHELAHLFLETEKQLAQDFGKTENHKRMLKWLGVNSFSEITVEHHEKFAETFEVYLEEGRAPSMALKEVFSRFRTWITQVYKNFRKDPRFRAQLTDESRYMFDRMLATEEQIAAMSSNAKFTPLFKSKEQAGMTDEEFEEYQKNPQKVKRKAQESLDKQIMSIITKQRTDEWNEEKRFLVDEEVERLKETRPYQIQEILKTNPLDLDMLREHLGIPEPVRGDDRFIPERTDSLLTLATKLGGLNMSVWSELGVDAAVLKDRKKNNRMVGKPMFRKDSGMTPAELVAIAKENGFGDMITEENVVEMVMTELAGETVISPEGQELLMERERKLAEGGSSTAQEEYVAKFVKKHGRKNGADPEIVAQYYGYDTVQEMIRDVAFIMPIKQKAEENAQQIMITQYGDILNNGTIEREVKEALENEEQAKGILAEIKAMTRKAGKPDRINRQELKDEAKRIIGSMKKSEIKPTRYYLASIKAAEKAGAATTDEERIQAKIQQLTNHYLYREATATLEKIEKQIRYVRKMQKKTWKPNEVGGDYRRIITLTANLYDVRTSKEERAMDDVMDIINWYNTQVENEASNYASILDPNLIEVMAAKREAMDKGEVFDADGYQFPRLDDLTAEEIQGFYDQLRHFRFMGGKEAQGSKNQEAKRREALAESIDKSGGKDYEDQKGVPDRWTTIKRMTSEYGFKQLSLRNMVRKLDNEWKDSNEGTAFEMIFRDIEDAHNKKIQLHGEMYDLMKNELQDIYKLRLDRRKVKYKLSDGRDWALGSEHRFMLALYWGTESSREAIMQGFGVTSQDVMKILGTMSKEELNTVNQMWRINEHLWPRLAETVIKHEGLAPPKLESTPFMVNGVQMTGGHMRLFYDSRDIEVMNEQQKAVDSAKIMPTKAGSAHARVGSGGRPVMLDMSNISRSIDDSIHYIAFADTGARVRSLVNSTEVKTVIEKKHGMGFHAAFVKQINSITGNRQSTGITPAIAKAMGYLRGAATARHLMYSVRNTLQQPTAIPIAMQEVGLSDWLNASKEFWTRRGHDEIKNFVNERSAFMAERASFVNREAAENIRQLGIQNTKLKKMWQTYLDYGFTPQTYVDSLIAYPTWIAKYEQEIAKHGNEQKAISVADTAVSESVGSGTDLHLSGMFQSTNDEFTKGFTMFGSWFAAYFQRMYRDTNGFTTADSKDALYTMVTTPMIVGVLSAMIILDIPDEDDEETSLWSWVAEQYLKFLGGTVVFLRDGVNFAMSGFAPTTPYIDFLESQARAYKGVTDMVSEDGERTTYKNVSDILKGISSATPIPAAGNVTRVLDYMDSYEKGEEEGGAMAPYQAIVEGKNKN